MLSSRSAWSWSQIDDFLSDHRIPMRLSVLDQGYPFICSLWYVYDQENKHLYAASHRDSRVVKLIASNDRCAFEISPNEPPYFGVRGKATATLSSEGAEEILRRAIDRYLGSANQRLASWLLGRAEEEILIDLTPVWLTTWDYSNRMEGRE